MDEILATSMEFLDLSDANDDEKREAMAIIESSPPNGVEFPFEFKSQLVVTESESSEVCSRSSSPNATNQSTRHSSQCSTPTMGRESRQSGSNSPHNGATHPSEAIATSVAQWDMHSGGQVVCGPPAGPPQYIYQPSYFPNGSIPTHYFPMPNGSLNVNSNKDTPKMARFTSPMPVNAGSKHAKSLPADMRPPFFPPVSQYSDGPPIIDTSRAPPSTMSNMVSDGIVLNGPPMFRPAFPHPPFISPPAATFTGPPMYLITTPAGSYLTYGIPSGIQMPQTSSPPSVPNLGSDENSIKSCEVPSNQENSSVNYVGVSVECNDEPLDRPNSSDNQDNHMYRQTNEQNLESNSSEMNSSITELSGFAIESQLNEPNEPNLTNPVNSGQSVITSQSTVMFASSTTSSPLVSPNVSSITASTTTTTAAIMTSPSKAWSSSGSQQRSWASLFKENASNHPLIASSLSSNSSPLISSSIVTNNYSLNSSGIDISLTGPDIINESDAQISSIPMRDDPFARKLAKKLRDICLKHSLPYLIPCGFVNRGNWCYINSTLQALLACPPFYNLMREIGETNGIFRDRSSTPIIDSFARFFAHFLPSEHMTKKQKVGANVQSEDLPIRDPFEPRYIYDVLGSIKSECLKGRQEDAEEFLSSVLNGLHEEMIGLSKLISNEYERNGVNGDHYTTNGHIERNENGDGFSDYYTNNDDQHMEDNGIVIENNNDDDDSNLWKEVGPRHRAMPTRTANVISTPIFDIFGGSTLSVRTAGKDVCGNRQPFIALQLDIQSDKVKSVEDALRYLTTSESIQGYMCSKTKQAMDASSQTFLDTLPPVLILHLKLFVYDMDGGCRKLMKRIEYPVDLELPRECLQWEREKNLQLKRYKLLSVVYHDGAEAVKGHYITDVYHIGSSQWMRCDDGSIKVIPMSKVLFAEASRTPYLLFYRRYDTLYAKNSAYSNSKGFSH